MFGIILNGQMILNDNGKIVVSSWYDLPNHYNNLVLDEFIIMPNHLHCIMIINNHVETGLRPVSENAIVKRHGISEFVRALKSFSSRKINLLRNSKYPEIWQARFFERVIRNDNELFYIRNYIINNPTNWLFDENNLK
jgi:putative transposase